MLIRINIHKVIKMKNYNIKLSMLLLAITSLAVVSSCKKYLEVKSDSTTPPEVVFGSTSNTNGAIIGVYNALSGDDGYGQRLSIFNPLMADDFRPTGNYSSSDQRGVAMYGSVSTNSGIGRPFNKLYGGIERANICIKFIPISNLYTTGTAAQKAEMGRYYGEALALRAQFYYELIRNWGDVPAPMIPAADQPDIYYKNVNRDETYDKILEDLRLAATLVPWRSEIPSYGSFRLTKGAIKGLRARIALARGGFSLRTATHLMEQRSDYIKYYQIALDECKEVMDKRSEHNLNPVYENIFKSLHSTNRLDNEHELMFEVAAAGGNASTDSKLGFANGLRFTAGSAYGSSNGGVVAIPTYFYEFDQYGDCRRDVTIAPFSVTATTSKILLQSNNWYDGKFRKSWTGYNANSTAQNYNINWPILRFADILLMFAEADNEIRNTPSIDAQNALKEVRSRAFVGFLNRMPAIPTTYSEFVDAIVKERLLEFGDEGIRKYDLIRWNKINRVFEDTRLKLRRFMNGEGEYANVPLTIYAKEVPFSGVSAAAEFAGLAVYDPVAGSKGLSDVLFKPTPAAPAAGLGYTTTVKIRSGIAEEDITGLLKGFATYFEPNKKELFPYPFDALNENPNMDQNYGYQR